MLPKALESIRVLEISHGISAPYCGKLLASLGADVIKVESPGFRGSSKTTNNAEYLYLNTGKKSITLDIGVTQGHDVLKKLIETVDVLIENHQPGFMASLGIDYPKLETFNTKLVMASISYFGQTGPYRDYKGNSMISYAVTGQMSMNGENDREPLVGAAYQPEYQAGIHTFDAILAALLWRQDSKQGQYVDVSVMESLAYYHEYALTAWSFVNAENIRAGNRYPTGNHPNTMYPCKDGYISITCVTKQQVEGVFRMFERPDMLSDPRYATKFARWEHAVDLDKVFLPWLMKHTMEEIVSCAQALRIPCAAAASFQQLLEDSQLNARDYWVRIEHPKTGIQTYAGAPFKMSETPWQVSRAPLLGEHNLEIYCGELGLTKTELKLMQDINIV